MIIFLTVHWLKESWQIWSYQTSRNVHFNIRHPVSNGIVTAVRNNADIGRAEFRLEGLSLGLLLSFCHTNKNSPNSNNFSTNHIYVVLRLQSFAVNDLECGFSVVRSYRRTIERKLDVLVLEIWYWTTTDGPKTVAEN